MDQNASHDARQRGGSEERRKKLRFVPMNSNCRPN